MSSIPCRLRLHPKTLACILFTRFTRIPTLYLIMALKILNNLGVEYHSVCLPQANTQRHTYTVIHSHHL